MTGKKNQNMDLRVVEMLQHCIVVVSPRTCDAPYQNDLHLYVVLHQRIFKTTFHGDIGR